VNFLTVLRAAGAVISIVLTLPAASYAQSGTGAYLAARQAARDSDFESAARYFNRALAKAPDNPELMENATASQLALGQIGLALPVAERMEEWGRKGQVGHMVVGAT